MPRACSRRAPGPPLRRRRCAATTGRSWWTARCRSPRWRTCWRSSGRPTPTATRTVPFPAWSCSTRGACPPPATTPTGADYASRSWTWTGAAWTRCSSRAPETWRETGRPEPDARPRRSQFSARQRWPARRACGSARPAPRPPGVRRHGSDSGSAWSTGRGVRPGGPEGSWTAGGREGRRTRRPSPRLTQHPALPNAPGRGASLTLSERCSIIRERPK